MQKEKRERRWNVDGITVNDDTEYEGTDDEDTEEEEDAEVEAARWKDPSWLRDDSVPKFQSLTARIIRSNKVPFSHLPPSLKQFVKMP